MAEKKEPSKGRRFKTPTVLQMEAVECGAAALAIILGYYKRFEPLEKVRVECGVSRDGSKASNMLKAARKYGLTAKGFTKEPHDLRSMRLPMIVFWNFNHFVVVEGFRKGRVYLNDPGSGPRVVSEQEFDQSFTGVVLTFEPGPDFKKGGEKRSFYGALIKRLRGSGSALVYVVLAGLALVIPGLVIPTFSKIFVDNILIGRMTGWIKPLVIGMIATAILRTALTWLQRRYLLRFETKLALASSSKFFWHVLRLPIEFFMQRYGGEIGSRVTINAQVANLLSGQLATTVLSVIMIGFYMALMFQYDIALTLIGIGIVLLNFVALRVVSQKRVNENQRLLQESGKLFGVSMGGLQLIETLKATGSENDFFAQWSGYQAKVVNSEQKLDIYTNMLLSVPPLLSALTTTAVLAFGSFRIMEGYLTIGMLVAFQSLMSSFLTPVNDLVNLGSTLQNIQGGMKRLDDVLSHAPDRLVPYKVQTDEAVKYEQPKLSGYLELKNVTFGYSRLAPPLIENFNLSLKPGSRIALVGGSGSGKSTIAKLVAGLYEPWAGEILFDGKAKEEIPRTILTNSLAMVDQDIFLFEGTTQENLTLWDATIPDTEIIRAAKDAYIHEEISARPNGYDGKVDETGKNFSGGQRQRLEIARALTGNPVILVLDEATSALDPLTEQIIDDSMRARGCACLIIAHRLSTIRDCDEIIVLDRGKVVERGTHDELKKIDGHYARLIRTE